MDVQSSSEAFAALLETGHVVTWGSDGAGGCSASIQHQLVNVKKIYGSRFGDAFAAVRADGSVVTWGCPEWGGDSSTVQDQLQDPDVIVGNILEFAAIVDGKIIAWGRPIEENAHSIQHQVHGVMGIAATAMAFAAWLESGHVVTWGPHQVGGDAGSANDLLRGVKCIQSSLGAFAALLEDVCTPEGMKTLFSIFENSCFETRISCGNNRFFLSRLF